MRWRSRRVGEEGFESLGPNPMGSGARRRTKSRSGCKVRTAMRLNEIEALWVVEKMDYYFLSGISRPRMDSLFVPRGGGPAARRQEGTGARENRNRRWVDCWISFPRELPALIQSHWGRLPKKRRRGARPSSGQRLPEVPGTLPGDALRRLPLPCCEVFAE